MESGTMSKSLTSLTLCSLLLIFLAAAAVAEHHEEPMKPAGYLGSFAKDFEGACKKLVSLAEAFPADKYGWRPGDGVRSVSESFIHTAGANFFFASRLGVPMPEDWTREAEKTITEKAAVIEALKKSIDHIHKALQAQAGADLDEEIPFFGENKRPKRGIFMIISGHAHEHLGQAIAYARVNGVVPPWSAGGDG